MDTPRLRVCLSALHYFPVYAGPAIRFRRYAPGLRDRGIEMQVFTCAQDAAGDCGPTPPTVPTPNDSSVEATMAGSSPPSQPQTPDAYPPVYRAPVRFTRDQRAWLQYGRHLVRHCKEPATRPDVVQLLSVSSWAIPALLRLRRAGIPIVFTRTMVRAPSGRPWERAVKDLLSTAPLAFIDRVVVSSRAMRADLLGRGVEARIEVIPNGVDLQRFRPCKSAAERNALRRRLQLDPNAEIVLFIGYLNARKGVDVLAEAWARIARDRPRARLVLIDSGRDREPSDPAFVARLHATLRASGAWDRLSITGPVENVEDYLRAADVFAFPSRREGMPNVVPEAFASGLPVVLAPFSGLPEEFGRAGREYLLVQRTPEAFAAEITRTLAEPGLRRELGTRARKWVEETLSYDVALDRYAALYRELSGAKPRAAPMPSR